MGSTAPRYKPKDRLILYLPVGVSPEVLEFLNDRHENGTLSHDVLGILQQHLEVGADATLPPVPNVVPEVPNAKPATVEKPRSANSELQRKLRQQAKSFGNRA